VEGLGFLLLLDHIAQCDDPLIVLQDSGDLWRLTGAGDFAGSLRQCPLRYVLADDLVRICTALAFSSGTELSGCLDLVHLPAERLWVEWNEVARCAELAHRVPECALPEAGGILRAGALVSARPDGRSGSVRTFWLPQGEAPQPALAAFETWIDLDGAPGRASPQAFFLGQAVGVYDARNPELDHVLQRVAFRFDTTWQRYYASVACEPVERAQVIQRSLSSVAFDVPMLLALFLLLSIRADLVQQPVSPLRINAKRARLGRRPLLEHIVVSAPVSVQVTEARERHSGALRRGPRFHHVRGHIVRRRDTVYWRAPHWRGHIRLGAIRSRTVTLEPGAGTVPRGTVVSGARAP
jgi:hypothetical protein